MSHFHGIQKKSTLGTKLLGVWVECLACSKAYKPIANASCVCLCLGGNQR